MDYPVAYKGDEPYIFISYAHRDEDSVLPIIAHLQLEGFRVWYDAGIEAGTEWRDYIAERIDQCGCVIAFLSQAALNSKNCKREINLAEELDKNVLVVYLEDLELTLGMRMQLNSLQSLYCSRHRTEESFLDALTGAQLLQNCRQHEENDTYAYDVTAWRGFLTDDPATARSTKKEKVWDIHTVWEPEDEPDYHDLYRGSRADELHFGMYLPVAWGEDSFYKKDYEKAFKLFMQAVDNGVPEAMTWLGRCYAGGRGVQTDYDKALYWFKSAAINGDPWGTYFYGYYVLYGTHGVVEKDYWKGISIQRKAAELGSPRAMWVLGDEYDQAYRQRELGHYMPHDPGMAQYWFSKVEAIARKEAEQGDPDAQHLLGCCYNRGGGVPRNEAMANYWIRKAEANGFVY